MTHPLVRDAAIVAGRWNMDIVDVLREEDPLLYAVRAAGHMILVELEKEQQEQR